jgi:hypothetical protein
MKAAELELTRTRGIDYSRRHLAVVKRRDVDSERVNAQTKLDKLLSPCMTIAATSRIPTPFLHLIYRWNVNLLKKRVHDRWHHKRVNHYLRHSFQFRCQREAGNLAAGTQGNAIQLNTYKIMFFIWCRTF